jgi:hypothetical protein
VLKRIAEKLTYANVVASLALFLALSGGVVWASGKIGASKLKANSVTTGKIKRNAITGGKIRPNAITAAKIKPGSIDFTRLAAGTNLVATAIGGPAQANGKDEVQIDFPGGAPTFASQPGTLNLLSVEARGNLSRAGEEPCEVTVVPFVNGSRWGTPKEGLQLSAFKPTAEQPAGLVSTAGVTGPVGLASPGTSQTVAVKVLGDPDCTAGSTVSVAVAVTQAK